MWHERENALKADVDQWYEKIMWIPDQFQYSEESTIQHGGCHNPDCTRFIKNDDKEDEFKLVAVQYKSGAVNIDIKPATTTLTPSMPDYVLHAEDYVIDGLPVSGYLISFNKSANDVWMACFDHGNSLWLSRREENYMVNSQSCTAEKMPGSTERQIMKTLTRDSVQVVFPWESKPVVYVNGIKTGSLQHTIKSTKCSYGYAFTSRFIMGNDTGIYYLSDTNLVYCTWASLSMLDFNACSILQKDIIDFDLTSNSYVCITTRNTLTKDGVDVSDIKSKACYRDLTTIGIVGSHAICAATVTDDASVILAYDMNGVFESSVTIQLKKDYIQAKDGICYIKSAGVAHGHAAFLVFERRQYVHLVVIDSRGKLSVRSRVEMPSNPIITCVAAYDDAGQFIVGSCQWIKKISVKM